MTSAVIMATNATIMSTNAVIQSTNNSAREEKERKDQEKKHNEHCQKVISEFNPASSVDVKQDYAQCILYTYPIQEHKKSSNGRVALIALVIIAVVLLAYFIYRRAMK